MLQTALISALSLSLVSVAAVAAINRPNALAARSHEYQQFATAESSESNLLDIVLVASVDGKFHALNRTSGQTLWSMSSNSSSSSSSAPTTFSPLVRTQHVESDPDTTDDGATHDELYVIEPQSGNIFVMSSATSALQRLPYTMPRLVEISPFSFPGDEDRRVFVGKKETSLMLIELETGKLKATINSECPWDPFEDLSDRDVFDLDLDELEGSAPPREMSVPTEIYIGRTGVWIFFYFSCPTHETWFSRSHIRLSHLHSYTSNRILSQPSNPELVLFDLRTQQPGSSAPIHLRAHRRRPLCRIAAQRGDHVLQGA